MTDIEKEKLRKGIAAYDFEQRLLLRILHRYRLFTEEDFDRWFATTKRPKFRPRKLTGESFMLGIGINGFNQWAGILELLQTMVLLGEVKVEKVDGLIVYSLP